MTRISNLPQDIRESYASMAEQFAMYSDYTDSLVEEAMAQMNVKLQESMERERQEREKAQEREHQFIIGMITNGMSDELICKIARISIDALEKIKQSIH